MTLEGDRVELLSRLASSLTEVRRFSGAFIPQVREEMIEIAFQAMADIGVFNRRHPELRINPLPT
jgi:hypothetical protein